MVSEHVLTLCQKAIQQLYGHFKKDLGRDPDEHRAAPSPQAIESARACGRWASTEPGLLFLQALADSLACLDADPMAGMVSPPLMASHGTMPLTAIAPLADIIRHCSNLIVRAEREIFFMTCSWAPSVAQRLIKDALIELSRRAGARGQRVMVKMMYDKASLASIVDPRQPLKPDSFASPQTQLPPPDTVPNLDVEVMTLHQLLVGTLHAKLCIVDRRIAAIMSNNVEDNPNMEMLTHVEGPIVDSVYDSALITWGHHLNPYLPSHRFPTAQEALPEHTPEDPHYDEDVSGEVVRIQSCYSATSSETLLQVVNRRLNLAAKSPIEPTGPSIPPGEEMTPYLATRTTRPVPMALVSRPPYGSPDSRNINVPQNEAWLSLIRNAKRDVFIQTPDLNAEPLIRSIAAALGRGVEVTYYVCFGYNDAGEVIPGQGGTNDQAASALMASLPEDGPERRLLKIYNYVGKDQDHPIHQCFKARTCHVKLLIADGVVGVQGSGNQDTQSWLHSQEMNIMVDSQEICAQWRDGIERNQNTRLFGRVAEDGIWRDSEGQPGEGYMGNPGRFEALIKGVSGMLRKMKSAGNI
ncbi:hypothetical protein ESCO_004567 [Escovopsis weberi]|uniref:PLD phosphodiesterase domain-containing protein n=1 Tax=Escovopsis weberi TaxID=150374 RepID=A0A0M8MYA0_ESCWE|nr:hypothetical protein ESCO_004567 [Escovopsis weberi]